MLKQVHNVNLREKKHYLTLEALRGGSNWPPLDFLGFKFLLLDRLSKAFEHIFWH